MMNKQLSRILGIFITVAIAAGVLAASSLTAFSDDISYPPDWDSIEQELINSIPPPPAVFHVAIFKGVDNEIVESALPVISKVFFDVPFLIVEREAEIPSEAYVDVRDKYYAGTILEALEKMKPKGSLGIIGFVKEPIFVGKIPLVNGIGYPDRGAAVVSLHMMDDGAKQTTTRRAASVGMHEIGHLLGADHSPTRDCAMAQANTIEELDLRAMDFIPLHVRNFYLRLSSQGVKLPPWSEYFEKRREEWTRDTRATRAMPEDQAPYAAALSSLPSVIEFSPADGARVPPDFGSIMIHFDNSENAPQMSPESIRVLLNGTEIKSFYHFGLKEAAAPADILAPGKYTVEVHAADIWGRTIEPLTFLFEVVGK